MCSMTGVPTTGTSGFGTSYVMGRSLVPRPAARSMALLKKQTFAAAVGKSYRRRSGALVPARQVLGLLRRQFVDRDAHRLELQLRDVLVDLRRQHVHLPLQPGWVLRKVLRRERLVREAHVHHRGGMALGRGEVDEPPHDKQEDPAAVT